MTSMTLSVARAIVRAWLRSNGYDLSLYPDAIIDAGIAECGEQLARMTKLLQRVSNINLAQNTDDLPSMPIGFRPDRLMSAYLTGDNVIVVPPNWGYSPFTQIGAPTATYGTLRSQLDLCPYQQLLELIYAYRTAITPPASGTITLYAGQPQKLAFKNRFGTAGKVFPQPFNQSYNCEMVWNELFVAPNFVPGIQGPFNTNATYNAGDVVTAGASNQTLYQSLVINNAGNNPTISGSTAWVSMGSGDIAPWGTSSTYNPGDQVTAGTSNQTLYQALVVNNNSDPTMISTAWSSLGLSPYSTPNAVTFTLPNDYMRPILMYGAPSKIQYNEPLGGFAQSALAKWNEFVQKMADQGDLGENYFQQQPAQRYDDQSWGLGNSAGWNGGW